MAYSYSRTTISAPRGSGYGSAISALQNSATQERKDVQSRYGSMAAAGRQQAVSSGLSIGSVLPTMQAGYARQMENALGSVNDRMNSGLASLYAQRAQANQQNYWQQIQAMMEAQRMGLQQAQMNQQGQNRYPMVQAQGGFRMMPSATVNPGSSGAYASRYRRFA